MRSAWLAMGLLLGSTAQAQTAEDSTCWSRAAERYGMPERLLVAIGQVESSLRPDAVAQANNGTRSVGLMQINSSWFSQLATYGITEEDLYDPCVSIHVGAWILSGEVRRYGYNWEAIGAYYAGPYDSKSRSWKLKHYREYAQKVLAKWAALIGHESPAPRAPGSGALRNREVEYVGGLGRKS